MATTLTSDVHGGPARDGTASDEAAAGIPAQGNSGRYRVAAAPRPVPPAAIAAHRTAATSARKQLKVYVRLLMITDSVVITIAVLGGYLARFQGAKPLGSSIPYAPFAAALAVIWLIALRANRCYDPKVLGHGADEYRRVTSATLRLAGAVAIIGYLVDVGISRGFLGIAFLGGVICLPISRYLARQSLHRDRARGAGWSHRVLVVGDAAHVLELVHQLRREPHAGYQVVGACIPDALIAPVPQRLDDVPIVGSFRNILAAAESVQAEMVAVTGSAELTGRRLRRLGWQMESTGIDLVLAPTLTDVAGPRIHTRPVAGLPLIHVESPEFSGAGKLVKGVVDRIIAILLLLVLSPLMLAIAVAVKVDSRGPVIFRQVRVGRGGREFGAYKFRSMVVNADALREQLAAKNETDGLLFKMRVDPRVTRIGSMLRKWSIDELPQLFNVVKGDMSLVGPRPPLPSEVANYDQEVSRRLLVKPGITGLWQVSGRSDLTWEESVRLDLYYVENWSLATDLAILWKTIGAVLQRRGAY